MENLGYPSLREMDFDEILNMSSDPIYVLDTEDKIIRANQALAQRLGISLQKLIGLKCFWRIIQTAEPHSRDVKLNMRKDIREFTTEMFIEQLGGWFSVTVKPLLNDDGSIKGSAYITRDITENKRAQKAILEAMEKAESGSRIKTAFMNNISHEVRTPLNGILGFSNLIIQPDISDEEKVQYTSFIKTSCSRLLGTITNYMDIALLASGNMEVNWKSMDMIQVFQCLYEKFQPICAEKNLELVFDIPQGTETMILYSDAELVQKIFQHLLENAVKFSNQGRITVGYLKYPGSCKFYVKDMGIGISPGHRSLIFEKFYQEESSVTMRSEGSGLGLSIAKGLVKLLGGKMSMDSMLGTGSIFFFTLPFGERTNSHQANEKVNIPKLENPVILVAEDDNTHLSLIKALFRKTDTVFLTANNGSDVVNLCREHPEISLVLMDIRMPGMDGLEATREIRSFRKDLPIIALTAYTLHEDERKALEAGCNYYLSKPVAADKLFEKLSQFGIGV